MIFDFWKRYDGSGVHPDDLETLRAWGEYYHEEATDLIFHVDPEPFSGPLRTAQIVLCFANPAFYEDDYFYVGDRAVNAFLRDKLDGRIPLLDDPREDTAVDWYEKKLRPILEASNGVINLDNLSRSTAILELIPYHSTRYSSNMHSLAQALPSSRAARDYLRSRLIPDALAGRKFVVILWKAWQWGVHQRMNRQHCLRVIPPRTARPGTLNYSIDGNHSIAQEIAFWWTRRRQ